MKRLSRTLTGAVAAVLAAGVFSACNSSPYAATVSGTVIPQTALNQQLAYADQAPIYQQLMETIEQQSTGNTVAVAGSGSGTHNKAWVALELTQLVQATIIHQAVVARHLQPGTAMLHAARGVLEAEMTPTAFAGVPSAFRDQLVQQVAEHAQLEQPSSDLSQLKQIYDQYTPDFYTQVCVRQISVTVTSPDGSIDFPASLAEAKDITSQFDSTSTVPSSSGTSGVSGGALTCYSQAQMQDQAPSFITTVMALPPGRAATPKKTGLGYDVVAVVSRRSEPFSGDVAKALQAVILQRQPTTDHAVLALNAKAHVDVNPTYGSWRPGSPKSSPAVVPPSVPASTPGG